MHHYFLGKMYCDLAKNTKNIYAKKAYLNSAKHNFNLYLAELKLPLLSDKNIATNMLQKTQMDKSTI